MKHALACDHRTMSLWFEQRQQIITIGWLLIAHQKSDTLCLWQTFNCVTDCCFKLLLDEKWRQQPIKPLFKNPDLGHSTSNDTDELFAILQAVYSSAFFWRQQRERERVMKTNCIWLCRSFIYQWQTLTKKWNMCRKKKCCTMLQFIAF